jgi:two-component system sensor histidine kinase ChvG
VKGAASQGVTSARSRYSMRLRVLAAVTIAAVAPQFLVLIWSILERPVAANTWRAAQRTAEAASKLIAEGAGDDLPREALDRLARERRVRIRVWSPPGGQTADLNHDDPLDPLHPIEAFFFGADAMTADELDEQLGPLDARRALVAALQSGQFIGCDTVGALVCQGAKRVDRVGGSRVVVHVQKSSARAVQAVYVLRHQLVRLSFVTVPVALALALYAASRVIRPIERLRDQALARAQQQAPAGSRELVGQDDEVGDVAAAFNALLAALESRRAENEAFIADVVHEMKSPVAAVRAAADALSSAAPDAQRAARLARVLDASSRKLDRLVTDFLELARAEAGMPNEEAAPVDLGELASALAERVREDVRYADLELTVERTPPGVLAVVSAVPQRIEACVRELLDNAASFAGARGRVALRVEVCPSEVVVTVEDSGPGIAEGDLPKVFTRFFTTRGAARGTGLGLALVRAVAEAHGGSVSARSPETGGAAFVVRLPRVNV